MKKYRSLVPIALIVLMGLSWYKLISDSIHVGNEYETYLTEARKYADDGITKYAMENYRMALEIESSPEIYAEIAEYYKAQKKTRDYVSWCDEFLGTYPTEPIAYEYDLDALLEAEDYSDCYDILKMAEKRNVSSDSIESTKKEIEYVYKMDFNSYSDVGVYSNQYCAVSSDGLWGYVNRYGEQKVSCIYTQAGAVTQSGYAPVINAEGLAYFIDKTGAKVLAAKDRYISFGLLVDNWIAAQKNDGHYIYVDTGFEERPEVFDYASTYNNGVAAVRQGNIWQLINHEGALLSNANYCDVALDEKQIAYRNERAFVAVADGKYIMIDGTGEKIGSLEFEDARVFAGELPTAVKISGKWQFIGKDGNLISNHKYDDARPFSCGLAAVCIDGKWGFVDETETLVIENRFYGAKDFNEKGSCFVKTGDKWQLLKLYRLNREE